jgi:hypothetical protein
MATLKDKKTFMNTFGEASVVNCMRIHIPSKHIYVYAHSISTYTGGSMYLWLCTPIAARLCAIHSTRGHCMEVGVGIKKTAETGKRNSVSKQVATS